MAARRRVSPADLQRIRLEAYQQGYEAAARDLAGARAMEEPPLRRGRVGAQILEIVGVEPGILLSDLKERVGLPRRSPVLHRMAACGSLVIEGVGSDATVRLGARA